MSKGASVARSTYTEMVAELMDRRTFLGSVKAQFLLFACAGSTTSTEGSASSTSTSLPSSTSTVAPSPSTTSAIVRQAVADFRFDPTIGEDEELVRGGIEFAQRYCSASAPRLVTTVAGAPAAYRRSRVLPCPSDPELRWRCRAAMAVRRQCGVCRLLGVDPRGGARTPSGAGAGRNATGDLRSAQSTPFARTRNERPVERCYGSVDVAGLPARLCGGRCSPRPNDERQSRPVVLPTAEQCERLAAALRRVVRAAGGGLLRRGGEAAQVSQQRRGHGPQGATTGECQSVDDNRGCRSRNDDRGPAGGTFSGVGCRARRRTRSVSRKGGPMKRPGDGGRMRCRLELRNPDTVVLHDPKA